MRAHIVLTTLGMWTDENRLLAALHKASDEAVARLPVDASLVAVQRAVADAIRRRCKTYNQKRPVVKVIAHENDPR